MTKYRTREDRMLNPWKWKQHADIKPISVNRAHYKNKKRTPLYLEYIDNWYDYLVGHSIPKDIEVSDMKFKLTVHVGFSNKASDLDNVLKPTLDIIKDYFGFDDKQVIHIEAHKHITSRGGDYIYVKLEEVFQEDYPPYNKEEKENDL